MKFESAKRRAKVQEPKSRKAKKRPLMIYIYTSAPSGDVYKPSANKTIDQSVIRYRLDSFRISFNLKVGN